jgi:hypothetical protein
MTALLTPRLQNKTKHEEKKERGTERGMPQVGKYIVLIQRRAFLKMKNAQKKEHTPFPNCPITSQPHSNNANPQA